MKSTTITIKTTHPARAVQQEVRRDIRALKSLQGIWKSKKIPNPVAWQRKIRREWERKLP